MPVNLPWRCWQQSAQWVQLWQRLHWDHHSHHLTPILHWLLHCAVLWICCVPRQQCPVHFCDSSLCDIHFNLGDWWRWRWLWLQQFKLLWRSRRAILCDALYWLCSCPSIWRQWWDNVIEHCVWRLCWSWEWVCRRSWWAFLQLPRRWWRWCCRLL